MNSAEIGLAPGEESVDRLAESPRKYIPIIDYIMFFTLERFHERGVLTRLERALIVDMRIMFLATSVQHRFQMRLI